ncbi:MAG: hypothetical protein ACI4JF_05465 [Oscillospiraceae bacterium]
MSELNNGFKEAVCAEVQRVFDSCSDRDFIYELPVMLNEESPVITDDMDVVRTRCVEAEVTCISVDEVPFKCGYYSVDITYRFKVTAEAFSHGSCRQQTGTVICGTALWNKRVILYGSEGNAKIFTSDRKLEPSDTCSCDIRSCCIKHNTTMPKATVRVLDPIALESKFKCVSASGEVSAERLCEEQTKHSYKRILTVSLGLFSIVQLSRPVSIIVPSYDYCIPCKDCSASDPSESPSEVFDRIEFPASQFFPQPCGDAAMYSSADDNDTEDNEHGGDV